MGNGHPKQQLSPVPTPMSRSLWALLHARFTEWNLGNKDVRLILSTHFDLLKLIASESAMLSNPLMTFLFVLYPDYMPNVLTVALSDSE